MSKVKLLKIFLLFTIIFGKTSFAASKIDEQNENFKDQKKIEITATLYTPLKISLKKKYIEENSLKSSEGFYIIEVYGDKHSEVSLSLNNLKEKRLKLNENGYGFLEVSSKLVSKNKNNLQLMYLNQQNKP